MRMLLHYVRLPVLENIFTGILWNVLSTLYICNRCHKQIAISCSTLFQLSFHVSRKFSFLLHLFSGWCIKFSLQVLWSHPSFLCTLLSFISVRMTSHPLVLVMHIFKWPLTSILPVLSTNHHPACPKGRHPKHIVSLLSSLVFHTLLWVLFIQPC